MQQKGMFSFVSFTFGVWYCLLPTVNSLLQQLTGNHLHPATKFLFVEKKRNTMSPKIDVGFKDNFRLWQTNQTLLLKGTFNQRWLMPHPMSPKSQSKLLGLSHCFVHNANSF